MELEKPRNLAMIAGAFYIPKDKPSRPRGEDAHFICKEAQVIGVADGVGGWAKRGIDAGEYARELMRNAAYTVEDCEPTDVDPKRVLEEAFLSTEARGSSTACIIALAGDILLAANLGDSGFLVIRDGKTFYRSPVQQHGFNSPYQIGHSIETTPEEAEDIVLGLEIGDIVIAGTDGLFDNLFPEDIEEIVGLCLEKKNNPPDFLAWRLAWAAREKSLDKNTASPFEVAAYEAGVKYFGGKYDDITVVVAYVLPPGLHYR